LVSGEIILGCFYRSCKKGGLPKKLIIENYIYIVPFVEEKKYMFLKTIIPSRKLTKEYLTEKGEMK